MTALRSHRSPATSTYDDAPPASHGGAARTLIVTDERAAEALTDPTTLRQVAPFLGRTLSVGEAAKEVGEKPNTTLRRVQR